MGARVIDGRGLTAELKEGLAAEVAGLRDTGVVPGLATVLVGSPAEVAVYRALEPLKVIEVAVHPVNAGLLAFGRPRYVPSTWRPLSTCSTATSLARIATLQSSTLAAT